jgi:hypothetical protein
MNARLAVLQRQHAVSTHFRERFAVNLEQVADILRNEPEYAQFRPEWSHDEELLFQIAHLRTGTPSSVL